MPEIVTSRDSGVLIRLFLQAAGRTHLNGIQRAFITMQKREIW